MKRVPSLLAIMLPIVSLNAVGSNYQFVAGSDDLYTQMCVAAGNNDRRTLVSKVSWAEDTISGVANNLHCNGLIISRFAYEYGAMDVYNYLNRKTRKDLRVPVGRVTISDLAMQSLEDSDKKIVVTVSAK